MRSIIFLLASVPFLCMAQISNIEAINDQLTVRPWLDNSTHNIYGYAITKVFGERIAPHRHSDLGPMTTMAYIDQEKLVNHIESMDVSKEHKEDLMEKAGDSPGGAVELFISRNTESRANFKWYFIVVRGADDNEKIMEIYLDYQAAQLPVENGWWNHTIVFLPEKPILPFYVYVNDQQSTHLSDYKFRVEQAVQR